MARLLSRRAARCFSHGALVFLSGDDDSDWRLPLAVWERGSPPSRWLYGWVTLSRWSVSELPQSRAASPADSRPASQPGDHWTPWRDRSTWIVAGVFAGQGLAYYLLVAGCRPCMKTLSISKTESAVLFAVFNLATFPAMVGAADSFRPHSVPANSHAAGVMHVLARVDWPGDRSGGATVAMGMACHGRIWSRRIVRDGSPDAGRHGPAW